LEDARDSAPTIVKEENPKVKNAFSWCGRMLALFSVFLIIYFIFRIMAFNIAENKWEILTSNYNETQFYKLEEVAKSLITTAPAEEWMKYMTKLRILRTRTDTYPSMKLRCW